jgi:quinol monooxygenase YgiN
MSEVILIVSLVAKPERQADAERFLDALLAPTHAEDGCLLYAVHRNVDDPTQLWFVERWASRPLLDKHLHSDHIQQALAEVDQYFNEGPVLRFCEALPGGEPDKGSIAGHATGVAPVS